MAEDLATNTGYFHYLGLNDGIVANLIANLKARLYRRPCIKLYPQPEEQNQFLHKLAKDARAPLSTSLINIIGEAIYNIPKVAPRNDQGPKELEAKCQDLQESWI